VSDNSNDEREFISIEKFEIRFPPSLFFPPRRRDFYASDSSDEKIIKEINNKGIGGDENVNIEENVKKIIEEDLEMIVKEIVEKIVRTRSGKKIKKIR
jgi:hypothetical protein